MTDRLTDGVDLGVDNQPNHLDASCQHSVPTRDSVMTISVQQSTSQRVRILKSECWRDTESPSQKICFGNYIITILF